jgi:DNA-binding MarR family transcriptional regulator
MSMTVVDRTRLVDTLKNLGLTKYEALVYIGLLGLREGTATEIHDRSGVPRASVYPVLNRLIGRNLVSISHTTPRRYRATSPDEGIRHLLDQIEMNAKQATEALYEIEHEPVHPERGDGELIWSIYGREHIRERLADLIERAETEVFLIAYWDLLQGKVAEALLHRSPHLRVEVICDRWEHPAPAQMSIRIAPAVPLRDSIPPHSMAAVLCIDGKQALVSMGSGEEQPSALFSESLGFVQFFMRYYRFISDWSKRV